MNDQVYASMRDEFLQIKTAEAKLALGGLVTGAAKALGKGSIARGGKSIASLGGGGAAKRFAGTAAKAAPAGPMARMGQGAKSVMGKARGMFG